MITLIDNLAGRLLALLDRPLTAVACRLLRLSPVDPSDHSDERLDDIIRRTTT